MADTAVAITAGSGTNIDTRTEATNGNHRQVVVLGDPSTNAGVAPVDATKGLAVDLTATGSNTNAIKVDGSAVTQPVSAASLPLPSGASTAAKQPALGTAGTPSSDVISVQGVSGGTALPISDNSGSITVDNAGTFATQATLQTGSNQIGHLEANQSVNMAQINGVTTLMGNGVTGTGSQRVTVASDNTPFAVKTDQTTHGTTDLVAADITKIGGTTIVTGGTNGTIGIAGIQAHDAADSGNNPVKIGAKAGSSEPSAVSASGDIVNLLADMVGKLIVLPYSNPENFVSGAITSAMTGTTSTSLIAAPAGSLRNYITAVTVSCAHATQGTDIILQDGSGGTTLYTIPAAAVYGGAHIVFPTPLRQPTAATALYCANVTTGSSTKVSAVGYKGL